MGLILASPHLFLYDMLIAVPGLIAAADALMTTRNRALYVTTAAIFFGPFTVPIAAAYGLQLTTVLLVAWLITLGLHPTRSVLSLQEPKAV